MTQASIAMFGAYPLTGADVILTGSEGITALAFADIDADGKADLSSSDSGTVVGGEPGDTPVFDAS